MHILLLRSTVQPSIPTQMSAMVMGIKLLRSTAQPSIPTQRRARVMNIILIRSILYTTCHNFSRTTAFNGHNLLIIYTPAKLNAKTNHNRFVLLKWRFQNLLNPLGFRYRDCFATTAMEILIISTKDYNSRYYLYTMTLHLFVVFKIGHNRHNHNPTKILKRVGVFQMNSC